MNRRTVWVAALACVALFSCATTGGGDDALHGENTGENTAQPSTAGGFLDRGLLFAVRGDFDLAIEDFTEAINLDGDFASAFLQRGKAYFARQTRLSGEITEGFEFDSFADSREKTDNDERAIADISQAIKLQPNNATAYN